MVVDVLQLLLRGECLLHQVSVEAAQAEHKDAEKDGDKGANET